MSSERKDGFVVNDRRYSVVDEETTDEPTPAAPPPRPEVDVERLRAALAELEDAKQRVRRDMDRQLDLERGRLLERLLPVLDNLDRSIAAAEKSGATGPLLDGVRLVHAQFLAALAALGLERRSTVGTRFDPRVHDAVALVPVADPAHDGLVVAELEPAYVAGDRVVRPAKVTVGRAAVRPSS